MVQVLTQGPEDVNFILSLSLPHATEQYNWVETGTWADQQIHMSRCVWASSSCNTPQESG